MTGAAPALTLLDVAYAVLAVAMLTGVLLIVAGYTENRKDEALGLRQHVPWFWRRR